MSREQYPRQLLPAYHFRGLLVGWRCSVCGHVFRVPIEEATDELAPQNISREFQDHSCAEVLIDEFRRKQA